MQQALNAMGSESTRVPSVAVQEDPLASARPGVGDRDGRQQSLDAGVEPVDSYTSARRGKRLRVFDVTSVRCAHVLSSDDQFKRNGT